jgi:hypothetical protein
LKEAGVHPDRFALDWASAAEAPLYVERITKFTTQIKELGPLWGPERAPKEPELKLMAARSAASSVKLRTRLARLTRDLRNVKDYSTQRMESLMEEKINEAILREMEKQGKPV